MGLNAPFFINTINRFYGGFMLLDEAKQILNKAGFDIKNDSISRSQKKAYHDLIKNIENAGFETSPSKVSIFVYDDLKCLCEIIYGDESFEIFYAKSPRITSKEFYSYSEIIDFINNLAKKCWDYHD